MAKDEEADEGPDKYTAIGDSGAGGAIGSLDALDAQGGNPEQLKQLIKPLQMAVNFQTVTGSESRTLA